MRGRAVNGMTDENQSAAADEVIANRRQTNGDGDEWQLLIFDVR